MSNVIEMEDYKWCRSCAKNILTSGWKCPRCGETLEAYRYNGDFEGKDYE